MIVIWVRSNQGDEHSPALDCFETVDSNGGLTFNLCPFVLRIRVNTSK